MLCVGIRELSQVPDCDGTCVELADKALHLACGIANPIDHGGALGDLAEALGDAGMRDIVWWTAIVDDMCMISELQADEVTQIASAMARLHVLEPDLWMRLLQCFAKEEGAVKSRSCAFHGIIEEVVRSCPDADCVWMALRAAVAAYPAEVENERDWEYVALAEGLAEAGRWKLVEECLALVLKPSISGDDELGRIAGYAKSQQQIHRLVRFVSVTERPEHALLNLGLAMARLGDLTGKADLTFEDDTMAKRLKYGTATAAMELGNLERADEFVEAALCYDRHDARWPDGDLVALAKDGAHALISKKAGKGSSAFPNSPAVQEVAPPSMHPSP